MTHHLTFKHLVVVLMLLVSTTGLAQTPVPILGYYNVRSYGAVGDGVTDDTAAITAAKTAIPATGGVLYFPPGIYSLTTNGISLNKSHVTYKGAGQFLSVLKISEAGNLMVSAAGISHVTVEDLGFNMNNMGGFALNLSRGSVGQTRISRCWFFGFDAATAAIYGQGVGPMVIDDSYFQGSAKGLGTSISFGGGVHDIVIRGNRFWYVNDGIIIDSGSGLSQTEMVSEYITIEDNDFDLGWWLLKERFSGSGGAVTYSSTVLTDTAAAFTGIVAFDNVRVMPVKQTGTGTFGNTNTKVLDASAMFITNLVRRGDILRTGATFAVVRSVESETVLWVEDWLSDTDRAPGTIPATGAYTVYGVYIGSIGSTTATTITVGRWHDFDGETVLPSAGTRYEVLYNRPNYNINVEIGVRHLKIINNRIKRGWSDQVSVYGYKAQIIGNTIEDGEDMGITLHGQEHIVTGNRITHQGAGGIVTTAIDSVIENNVFSDTPWVNPVDAYLSNLIIWGSSRLIVANNRFVRGTTTVGRYAIVLFHPADATPTATDNVLSGNISSDFLTADYKIDGDDNVGTRLYDNVGSVLLANGALVGDQRGQYGEPTISGCGSGATVRARSSDTVGSLTVGTTPGTCVVTFKLPRSAAPICTLNNQTTAQLARATAVSATAFTVGGTIAASDVITWHCGSIQ